MAHIEFMRRAIALTNRAHTFPSPCVGCVIVKDGQIICEGFTQEGGRPHAEYVALEMAGNLAIGADIYVTLEPCAHESVRGPTCSKLIIDTKPKNVFIAMQDPDPRTMGKGISALKANGINVHLGLLEEEAKSAHSEFINSISTALK
ncbi:MAG: bifunctional diaminohydroxyphosphoribosylaminopyrimidine deaminase/5-amino-6-(5-phosphoribosylamino)uracil reductase RibD [Proteobacteria bacterium]|nr:bifunctional diaminohydroxyphosphoribosylaminopyrimidine deaminase/5-amino-6-(5-phosphoribosylamino)uracil reductase RibD [Pseudomonadota bacterium]